MKYVVLTLLMAFTLFVVVICVMSVGENREFHRKVDRLVDEQVVQAVQLQDARDRIRALEVELDRLAPHTPNTQ